MLAYFPVEIGAVIFDGLQAVEAAAVTPDELRPVEIAVAPTCSGGSRSRSVAHQAKPMCRISSGVKQAATVVDPHCGSGYAHRVCNSHVSRRGHLLCGFVHRQPRHPAVLIALVLGLRSSGIGTQARRRPASCSCRRR
jgi:hypothetical protein